MFNQAQRLFGIPIQGSEISSQWDCLYGFLFWLSVILFFAIIGVMLYFMISYRYKEGQKTTYIRDHHFLEKVFIILPTLLVLGIFVWGLSLYHQMVQSPTNAYEIRVIGKQWLWQFLYDDGRTTTNEVFVPMGRPIKFVMTSEDVLHSFFVPNFRIKQDVVPGMYTTVWFTPIIPGKHVAFCTEFCGTAHSQMLARVVVLKEEEWQNWLHQRPVEGGALLTYEGLPVASSLSAEESASVQSPSVRAVFTLVDQGRQLYKAKGCIACHSVDGQAGIGPTHLGLFGRKVELADGRTLVADENYIRKHIEDPQSLTTKGYQPIMPTFKGLLSVTEMEAMIAYLKSLK